MANTYSLLDSVTVNVSTANVTFSNIPSGYTDLAVWISARSNRSAASTDNIRFRFNDDSGANYNYDSFYTAASNSTAYDFGANMTSGIIGNYITTIGGSAYWSSIFMYIPNYTTNGIKIIQNDMANEYDGYASIASNSWTGTSAITKIYFYAQVADGFTQYSTFQLYGIKSN